MPLGNVVRKMHAKILRSNLIIKDLKSEEAETEDTISGSISPYFNVS